MEDDRVQPRRRVLVSANAVSPARGSEPGVGWQICSRLARYHDVTVLCAPGVPGPDATCFRDEIDAAPAVPGLTIRFVEPPLLSRLFQRETTLCRRTVYYTGYAAWQRAAYAAAKGLPRFDIVHHLNMTGFREPGFLWKLDAPFVWGPVGGAANYPVGFYDLLSARDRLFYRVRTGTNRLQFESRRCRAAAAKTRSCWAISGEDEQLLHSWGLSPDRMLETGSTPRPAAAVRSYDGARPLGVVWSGRHLGRKALPVLLRAAASIKDKLDLTVLGDGPETGAWKALAESLGVPVRWTGNLTQSAAMTAVSAADVMAFTSVLEGTPHAVVESLSLGVPVVCHDACGMGSAVTPDSGVLVPMRSSAQSVAGFAAALKALAGEPSAVRRLSEGALARSADLTWDRIVGRIVAAYEQVFDQARVKPPGIGHRQGSVS